MTRYRKCHECDFLENKCYIKPETVISVCNKYHCVTNPEGTCKNHKKHGHWNYDPQIVVE